MSGRGYVRRNVRARKGDVAQLSYRMGGAADAPAVRLCRGGARFEGPCGPFLLRERRACARDQNEKRSGDMAREMTGAEMVIQALADQGVEHLFGYPGGAVLPIYDELFKQERVRHILVRHEQGAVHAAEGYARSTGKVGCVLVTSGPGATNAVTGLTDALMDTIPLVCITGQVP